MTMHVFATIMALYPITPTEQIAEEFDIPVYKLREIARKCRVKKSHEFRSEICRRNSYASVQERMKATERRIRRTMKLLNEGYSEEEVAKRFKITVNTVYKYRLKWNKKQLNH